MSRHARRALPALCVLLSVLLVPWTALAGGVLLARGPGGVDRGQFPLVRTEVRAEVAGQVIQARVSERFRNGYAERIEAVYVFPLPEGAAVDEMEMHLGARVVRAVIRRRDDARQAYEQARDQGQQAALLEQERPNIFTFSVANVDPGGEIEVVLRYFEVARYDHGTYEMVFPMTVGPRYVPGAPLWGPPSGTGTHADTDRVPDASRLSPGYAAPGTRVGHAVGVNVHLEAGAPVQSVETPAHDVAVTRSGATVVDLALRDKDEIPNRDFILRWRLDAPRLQTAVLAHRPDPAADGYLAVLLEPQHDLPVTDIAPRELVFLLDTSGSMQGVPLDTAVAAVNRALDTLGPADTFQIIDFADSASSFAPAPLPNQPVHLEAARRYLANLHGGGGTNQLAGIHAALSAPPDPARLRYVLFMTDGYIGNESEVVALTQHELGNARIFGLGVGSSVNRFLLDEVSRAGRGYAEYLRPHEDARELVERFYQRIGRPWLTDVEVDWGGLAVTDVYPRPLPDLSGFQPLALYARYRGPGQGIVTVRGRLAGRPFAQAVPVVLPAREGAHQAVSRVWAREKISYLSRETYRNGEAPELVQSITAVALSHHLVSRYTSLVAVDDALPASTPPGTPTRVDQPVDAPAGVNLATAGGVVRSPARYAIRPNVSAPTPPALGVSGWGGLAITGTGWGGGGSGEATVGLGRIGTMGHGAGTGSGSGYGSGYGSGLRGRGVAGPAVRAAPPTISGMLSPEAIRRVVLRNLGQVQHCYEQGLVQDPALSGRVTVRFLIGATGQVQAAQVAESSLASPAVAQCIAAALLRWTFPAPAGGGVVTVSYPFNLTPAPGSRPAPAPVPAPAPATPAMPATPPARPATRR